MKYGLLAFLFLAFSTAFADISDSDVISRDLEKKTLVFKKEVTVKAGPRYQSTKILWDAGPRRVRAWLLPETEKGVTIPKGKKAVVQRVYANKTNLLGANVKVKTTDDEELSVILQYYVSDDDAVRGNVEIPTVGDLKLAFDIE
jgi:hypothetical protein